MSKVSSIKILNVGLMFILLANLLIALFCTIYYSHFFWGPNLINGESKNHVGSNSLFTHIYRERNAQVHELSKLGLKMSHGCRKIVKENSD